MFCWSTLKAGKIRIWQHWFLRRVESQILQERDENQPKKSTSTCQNQTRNKLVGDDCTRVTLPSLHPKFGNIVPLQKKHVNPNDGHCQSMLQLSLTIKHFVHFLHNSVCVYFFDDEYQFTVKSS